MKTDDIVKYLLIGFGVYVVWQYVLAPMMATSANLAAPQATATIPSSAFPTTTTPAQINSGGPVTVIATPQQAIPLTAFVTTGNPNIVGAQ